LNPKTQQAQNKAEEELRNLNMTFYEKDAQNCTSRDSLADHRQADYSPITITDNKYQDKSDVSKSKLKV
jgi:hypothetical protein